MKSGGFDPWSLLASTVVVSLLKPKSAGQPPSAPPITPPPEPQAAKTPDEMNVRRAGAASAAGAAGSTLLTGPSGVAPSLLNLGRNSRLGD